MVKVVIVMIISVVVCYFFFILQSTLNNIFVYEMLQIKYIIITIIKPSLKPKTGINSLSQGTSRPFAQANSQITNNILMNEQPVNVGYII